jgi:hypothetical protein
MGMLSSPEYLSSDKECLGVKDRALRLLPRLGLGFACSTQVGIVNTCCQIQECCTTGCPSVVDGVELNASMEDLASAGGQRFGYRM